MSSDAIPQLPPAIPVGMEAALGVALPSALENDRAESNALAMRLGVELENDAALEDSKVAAAEVRHQAMKMPDVWQAIASENELDSPAQARSVVATALRLATNQARDHGSFRMGSLLKFTRLKRGSDREPSNVDITPLAKVQKCAQ